MRVTIARNKKKNYMKNESISLNIKIIIAMNVFQKQILSFQMKFVRKKHLDYD